MGYPFSELISLMGIFKYSSYLLIDFIDIVDARLIELVLGYSFSELIFDDDNHIFLLYIDKFFDIVDDRMHFRGCP